MLRLRSVLMLSFIVAACASFQRTPPEQTEDDVREAVFRHLFTHNGSAIQQDAAVYCLAIGPLARYDHPLRTSDERDPDERFLRRFAGHSPRVLRAAQCVYVDSKMRGVLDPQSRKPGVQLTVGAIEWTEGGSAEVSARYHEGGLSAAGYTCPVRREGRLWKVSRCRMHWIS